MFPWRSAVVLAIVITATAHVRGCLSFAPLQHHHHAGIRSSPVDYNGVAFSENYLCMKRRTSARVRGQSVPRDDDNDDDKKQSAKRRHVESPSPDNNNKKKKSNAKSTAPATADSSVAKRQPDQAVASIKSVGTMLPFRATQAHEAQSLSDGALLKSGWFIDEPAATTPATTTTILPWVGFGTYRLGQKQAYDATLQALECGYRCIDTAFIYGGETTEGEVGRALQTALDTKILQDRSDVFLITKQWRKYHGYDETLKCLELSLKRLQVDYIDLYLIHWPGPGWTTPFRRNDVLEEHGPWHYTNVTPEEMVHLRAETWRAMEDAVKAGKIKAIGVSNFTIRQLETLRKTARLWPPAVNQVECHPLYPQHELRAYCESQGIVVQAYAALGGQDATKAQWKLLLEGNSSSSSAKDKDGKKIPRNLLSSSPVLSVAQELGVTPAQVLLRFALQRECAITPKASSPEHMLENANLFSFSLTPNHMTTLDQLFSKNAALQKDPHQGRLCWRSEPLRLLDFD